MSILNFKQILHMCSSKLTLLTLMFMVPPCFQEMYRQPSQGFFERSLLEAYVGPLPISKMEPLAKIASITKSSI